MIFCFGGAGIDDDESSDSDSSESISSSSSDIDSGLIFDDFDLDLEVDVWAVWKRLREEGRVSESVALSFPFFDFLDVGLDWMVRGRIDRVGIKHTADVPVNRSISFLNLFLSNVTPPEVSRLNADAIVCMYVCIYVCIYSTLTLLSTYTKLIHKF